MRSHHRFAFALVAATFVTALLAVAGAPRWGALAITVLATLSTLPLLRCRRGHAQMSPLVALLLGLCALTALQWLPLPFGLVEWLSPVRADVARSAHSVLGQAAPRWLALSMDPPATALELAKFLGYLAIAVVALRLAAIERGSLLLLRLVALAAVVCATIAIGHYLVKAESLWGVYRPERVVSSFLAPLLNPNHLAGFSAMGACAALGLAFHERVASLRLAWFGGASLCVATTLLQESRGATVALALGLALTLGVLLWHRRGLTHDSQAEGPRGVWQQRIAIAVVAICACALLLLLTTRGVTLAFENTDVADLTGKREGKVAAWRAATELVQEFPLTGVGRGGFETTFSRVHQPDGQAIYSHVENLYLQVLVDFGWLGTALLLFLVVGLVKLSAQRSTHSALAAGSCGALVTLAIHNVVDFSIEMPLVALAGVLCAATLSGYPLGQRRLVRARQQRVHGAAVAAVALVTANAAAPWTTQSRADRDWLHELSARDLETTQLLTAARQVMLRHPSDFYPPLVAAATQFKNRDRQAVALVNHGLRLNPHHVGLHRLAADILVTAGHTAQACIHYAQAMRHAQTPQKLIPALLASGIEVTPRCFALDDARVFQAIDALEQGGHRDLAQRIAREAYSVQPDSAEILLRIGRYALAEGNLLEATRVLERANELAPTASSAIALAEAWAAGGRAPAAIDRLQGALRRTTEPHTRVQLLATLSEIHKQIGQLDAGRSALRQALGAAGDNAVLLTSVHLRLSAIEAALGNAAQADWHQQQARAISNP